MTTIGGGHASLLGSTFGGYEIISLIGRGATGTVYLAHDVALRRYVALKVLLGSLARNPLLVKSFYHEAQAAAPLRHPGIVQVYSAGIEQGTPYIAMEYIAGEPLDRFLRRKGAIHWTSALYIGAQVAESLAYAHSRGVIHRDVKPANIMLDTSGRVHLTDFGIANIAAAETGIPAKGAFIGTPKYMSPEQCTGEAVTASTDTYSLGVTMYQMICARLPFDSDSPMTLIKMITSDEPERLNKINREVPDDVSRLVAYMMQKQASNRPKDAQTVCRIIDRLQVEKGGRSAIPAALAAFIREQSQIPLTQTAMTPGARQTADALSGGDGRSFSSRRFAPVLLGPVGRFAALIAVLVTAFIAAFDFGLMETEAQPLTVTDLEIQFDDTQENLLLARLGTRSLYITDFVWVGNLPAGIARVEGIPGSLSDGANGLLAVHPGIRNGFGIRTPIAPGTTPSYRAMYVSPRSPSTIPTYLDDQSPFVESMLVVERREGGRRHEGMFAVRTQKWNEAEPRGPVLHQVSSPEWNPNVGKPWRANETGNVIAKPDGRTLCFVLNDPVNGGNYLIEFDTLESADQRRGRRLTSPGAWIPPESVHYSPNGVHIVYQREYAGGEREVWVVASGGADDDGLPVTRQGLISEHSAFSPDSRTLAIAVKPSADAAPEIRIIDVNEATVMARLGEGWISTEPWHPSGKYLVASAAPPPVAGTTAQSSIQQLWAIGTAAPHKRGQLTQLDAGVRGGGAVSRDGRWAATVADTNVNPMLVFVDLSKYDPDKEPPAE